MLGETIEKIIAKNIEEARSEGYKIGLKKVRQNVARNTLKKGYSVEFISSVTEIPTSDLEKIQSQQT